MAVPLHPDSAAGNLKMLTHCICSPSTTFVLKPQIRIPLSAARIHLWEPSSAVAYLTKEQEEESNFLNKTANIFETLIAESVPETTWDEAQVTGTSIKEAAELLFFRWPQWVIGPSILLVTDMIPSLWLPLSSIFLGPNIAILLSLVRLDCIFNLGVALFLLRADSSARPSTAPQICESEAPSSYQFWDIIASFAFLLIPALVLLSSRKGILQPQLPFIPVAVLLGPYALLLFVQVLTEALTGTGDQLIGS